MPLGSRRNIGPVEESVKWAIIAMQTERVHQDCERPIRIHAGNDSRRPVQLDPTTASVFAHLTDRLVIQTHGWVC